jgi:glutamate-1-semialdehyde 2,1-aminomutase
MWESSTYRAIFLEGKAEGLAEVRAEAKARATAEAQMAQARRMLLLLGRKRLGPPSPKVEATVEAMTDLDYVEQMVERLYDVSSWEEWNTESHSAKIESRTLAPPTMNTATPARSKPDFRLPLSHDAFARANRVIPGGVNSPARAFGGVGGEPPFIERAEGAYLHDIDGHSYIDYVGSWGPMILGHAHPSVRAAVSSALELGSSFGAPTIREIEIAELVAAAVPSIEKVRFVSSGTEASMSAVRLARGATGRSKIIKMTGHYHGHVDALLVQAGSAATTLGTPNSPGVTQGSVDDTILCPFNDVQAVAGAFARFPRQVAAVILEPIAGNMGLVPPRPGYLAALRELTAGDGCLLVFDEVMTGFRVAFGGAQQLYGITPDLTVLGKIVGGGLPAAAYGASAALMNQISPAGPIYQAGTLSGNPLAMAAGLATLRSLRDDPPYGRLEALSARLAEGLDRAATDASIPHVVQRAGSMLTFFFHDGPVHDYADACRSDTPVFARYFWEMLARGVYLPCSQFEAAFVSAAHTESDIDRTIEAAREALLLARS